MQNRTFLKKQLVRLSKEFNKLDVEYYLSSANLLKTNGKHYVTEEEYFTRYNSLMDEMSEILQMFDYDEFSKVFGVNVNLN